MKRADLITLAKSVIFDNLLNRIKADKHQALELAILDSTVIKDDDIVDDFSSSDPTKVSSANSSKILNDTKYQIGRYSTTKDWLDSSDIKEGEYDISIESAGQNIFGYTHFKFKVQYLNLGTEYIHTIESLDGRKFRRASVLNNYPDFEGIVDSSIDSPITIITETPLGVIDGVNQAFTLSLTPISNGSIIFSVNGIRRNTSLNGNVVTLDFAPAIGSVLLVTYFKSYNVVQVLVSDISNIDSITPHIGGNGNWFIGATDTTVKAAGTNGTDGANGKDGINGINGTNGVSAPLNVVLNKIGVNGSVFPPIFKWTTNLIVSVVELTSNCTEISATINGISYNHTTLVGISLPSGTELVINDIMIATGFSNATAIIIFSQS
jgi:hypothetical protein